MRKIIITNKLHDLTGGLFSEDEEEQELVFRFAVDRINADPSILPKSTLVAQVERIGKEDSFHADKKGLYSIHDYFIIEE